MKKSYLLYALAVAALPLVMTAKDYTLKIHTKSGETIEYATKDIDKIDFEEIQENPPVEKTKLDKMTVVTTSTGENSFLFNWSPVANAEAYRWVTDGNNAYQPTTSGLQCSVSDLKVGEHTIVFTALPAEGSNYLESDPVEVKVTANLLININMIDFTKDSFNITTTANTDQKVTVGIVPSTMTVAADQISYVKSNSAAQRHEYTPAGKAENISFTGLAAGTSYIIVAFVSDATNKTFTLNATTKRDERPGDKGSVYPPGVTATTGWIDVDKIGDLGGHGWTGADNEMCWACAISGMVQWWLNDYKSKTGKDFQTVYPVPAQSKCYTTPIMDLYVDYYPHSGGNMFEPLKWFFRPVDSNIYDQNGKVLNESLPYWKGGFGGMTEDEAQALMVVNAVSSDGYNPPQYDFNRLRDIKGKTSAESARIFSERIISALQQGPLALSLTAGKTGGSVHGVSCWGADYEILSDGSYKVTTLYFSENDPIAGNKKNGLNTISIVYDGDYVTGTASSTGTTKYLNLFFGIRGYQGK